MCLGIILLRQICSCNPQYSYEYTRSTGDSDTAMYTIARQNTISSQRLWKYCIGLLLMEFAVGTSLKALHRAPRSARVVNSYFVHVHSEISWDRVQELLEELQVLDSDKEQPGFKARVQGTVTQAGYGFAAHLSEQALEKVRSHEAVEFVEEDQYVWAGETRTVTAWGLDRIDQVSSEADFRFHPPCNLTGRGVDIYVMDSGIRYSHQDFSGRAHYPDCDVTDLIAGERMRGRDCTGHGTHVAGIIGGRTYGVAPGADIYSVRVLDCTNRGSWNTVVQGIECILNRTKDHSGRPAVVNMSIYGQRSRVIKRAIERLIRHGITVVGIAGNNDNYRPKDSCKISPASVQGVIAVSASTRQDQVFSKSNAGMCVDIYAPGKDTLSSSWTCDTCQDARSGSSMAAPHVTGALALLLEKCPELPPWKARYHLLTDMALASRLDTAPIPKRLLKTTPNLLLHVGPAMCSIEC